MSGEVEPEEAEYLRLLAEHEATEARFRAEQRALRESGDRLVRHVAASRAGETPAQGEGERDAVSRRDFKRHEFASPDSTPTPRRNVVPGMGVGELGKGRERSPDGGDARGQEGEEEVGMVASLVAKLGELSDRLDMLEAGRPTGKGEMKDGERRGDRRATLSVRGTEVPLSSFPQSLRDPRLTAKFDGTPREDVDQFLRRFEKETELVDPVFATPMLLRCLGEVPAHSFRQNFEGRPTDVEYESAAKFLRARYRKPTHAHEVLRKVVGYSQKGSAEVFFANVEEKLALVGVDPERAEAKMEAVLVAVVSRGLKEKVYGKMREDPQRFTPEYRYAKFKADAIALDRALFSAAAGKPAMRVAWADIVEEWDREKERERESEQEGEPQPGEMEGWLTDRSEEEKGELRVLLGFGQTGGRGSGGVSRGRGGRSGRGGGRYSAGRFGDRSGVNAPRQPAYKFPADYKGDVKCRYCRSPDHLAPLCELLFKNRNRGEAMPEELKRRNRSELGIT